MGHPRLGYLFAKMALDLPYPENDILFVSADVYKYGILDEIGSTAFYAGKPHIGYSACKKLLSENLLPENDQARVQNNLKEYLRFFEQTNQMHVIQQIDEQAKRQSEKMVGLKPANFPAQLPKKKFKQRKPISR